MLSRLTFDTLVSANEKKKKNSSLRISIINLRNIFLQKPNAKGRNAGIYEEFRKTVKLYNSCKKNRNRC